MRFRIPALLAVVGLLVGCSGGDGGGVEPVNNAPTIAFQFSKIGIVKNVPTTLSVNVNDLDGDPMTVSWAPTRGTITSLNPPTNTQVRWNPPDAVGVDTIAVTVSDGTASKTIREQIKVGFPFNGSAAPNLFRKDRSPYIVTVTGTPPLLLIDAPTIIEAGVEILLETPGAEFDVTDSLTVVGTPDDPIMIRPNVRHQTCSDDRGWWAGIKVANFLRTGILEMDYAFIWYAQWGVRLRDSGAARIRHSEIRCSGQNGILHESSGALELESTRVSDGLLDGVEVTSLSLLPDAITIRECNIAFNGGSGLVFDLADSLATVPIVVEYTNLEFNGDHAITLANAVFPEIHYNRFLGNGVPLSNIWCYSGYAFGTAFTTLNVTCNFWGAPVNNVSTIEATIRDAQDTATVQGDMVVSPWSNENPLVGPSSCTVR
jgi:hypothetical protein